MKRALVTGGCGFVGRHLVRRLILMDYHVTIVDNFYKGSGYLPIEKWPDNINVNKYLNQITFHNMDCRHFFKNESIYFDEIFHLAAVVGGRMVIETEPLAVGKDLSIDADFFYWLSALKQKPIKVHYFSSSAAYPIELQGFTNHNSLREIDINFNNHYLGRPDLTYGWSKLTGEYLANIYYQKFQCPIICYRPFSGYGEDQDLTYPFPSIVKRCFESKDDTPILVWGSGHQVRDFIYIEDCIDLICNHSHEIFDASAINISTGIATSFNNLCNTILNLLGKKNNIINNADKPEGVFYRVGSIDRQLQNGFKYSTFIENGISKSIEYLEKNNINI